MFPASNIFALWRAPFSGDVTQAIEPRLFSGDIAGEPETEALINREVASYGKQLGKILEALLLLAEHSDTPLPQIAALQAEIEGAKARSASRLAARAAETLDQLQKIDPTAHEALLRARRAQDPSG